MDCTKFQQSPADRTKVYEYKRNVNCNRINLCPTKRYKWGQVKVITIAHLISVSHFPQIGILSGFAAC